MQIYIWYTSNNIAHVRRERGLLKVNAVATI
jgi:hypothetical protein